MKQNIKGQKNEILLNKFTCGTDKDVGTFSAFSAHFLLFGLAEFLGFLT